jgi:hypothetical protein
MVTQTLEATIHYKHSVEEVAELDRAVKPMGEYIARSSRHGERQKMRHILGGDYFRRRDALAMKSMLLRSCKFARAHLDEYFPAMRQEILINTQILEIAANRYWRDFERLMAESTPTH